MAIRRRPRSSRTPIPAPRGHVPRLPHSSWRLAPAGLTTDCGKSLTSASEFWARLGL